MHIEDVLRSMRAGEEQSDDAIAWFVRGAAEGQVSRPQAAAWLAWAFSRGLTDQETIALTAAMTGSGVVLKWPDGPPLFDKHSTGGVGDKVSLILGPLWAELGVRVPMISGRGLGHTGGTLDKLEAIPGFRVDLSEAELRQVLAEVGCFISGQTGELAPADRVLYALRNETSTVESIPLIVGSILSKKLAEGVERLILDVKTGTGAFMEKAEDALALAHALVRVAEGNGVRCSALITAMERPLGHAIGNALEVIEAIECMRGGGPDDLRELVIALADHPDARNVLASGRALERFGRMVEAQGGNRACLDDHSLLRGTGTREQLVLAQADGFVQRVDAMELGRAAFELGAGRRRSTDPVDFGVGLWAGAKPGHQVQRGQPLVIVHHRDGRGLDEALQRIERGIVIGPAAPDVPPLIHHRVG
jgi:pyrimidine-nucleoside phosphorylase